jgi:uncharacterized membrane protein YgaE (UPF0421/DUF939 family)
VDTQRIRTSPERAWRRLRPGLWPIAQTAAAAGGAWFLAGLIPGHAQPTFAPIAAVVAMTAGRGRRGLAAVQLILGVAFGIALASLLVHVLGDGAWQLILIVALTMGVARAVGLPSFMVTQAGVWSVIVVASTHGEIRIAQTRLVDALVGGGVALLLAQVLVPAHPLDLVAEAARDTEHGIDDVIADVAEALRCGDADRAARAVDRADAIELGRLSETLEVARDVARRAPRRRHLRRSVDETGEVAHALRQRARDARVLAVAALRLLRGDDPVPEPLVRAVDALARERPDAAVEAVRELGGDGLAAEIVAQQVVSLARRSPFDQRHDRHDRESARAPAGLRR